MKETTLREILKYSPCNSGLKKLLEGLNYSNPVTEQEKDLPVKTLFILENNGYDDCLWSLICFSGTSNWYRFKADIAESVLKYYENIYPNDNRPRRSIETSRNLADVIDSAYSADSVYSAARYAARCARCARSAADSAYSAAHSADSASEKQKQINVEILKKYIM